ncbi:MAG: pre-16S rRNA-processing nuclease YqgF [Thermostichus sp. HHBFW_bins_43]
MTPSPHSSDPKQGRVLIGFDPGRDKCGIAVVQVEPGFAILHRQVVAAPEALAQLKALWQHFQAEQVILGNQTTAQEWQRQLQAVIPPEQVALVDERYSSQEARQRYWEFYPPQGWERLLPQGMRVPANAYDDLVALILVERYCRGRDAG